MRAAVYLRQSLDRLGDGLAVGRQREDCQRIVTERGWTLVETYVDSSVSASDRKARRPGYDRMVGEFAAGRFDALVCWDLDRLTRQPRQLEDWIDAATEKGLLLTTANGEADLSTDGGRTFARIKASIARGEVERKGARHVRANLQAAGDGRPPSGGPVPFGFRDIVERDDRGRATQRRREHHPEQAQAIRDAYAAVLGGASVASIAAAWNNAGLASGRARTARGHRGEPSPWTGGTVRVLLGKARNAGLREHRGEVVGPARWQPIVSEETWRAALAELDGRQERETRPRNVRHLLSGVATCGVCGGTINAGTSYRGRHSYRCREALGHVARRGDHADEYVAALVVERLSRPDAVDLLTPQQRDDVAELRSEAGALRARLDGVATEFADGDLTASQLRTITDRLRTKLTEVEARLAEAGRTDVVGPLVTADDVQTTWNAMHVEQQRAAISALMRVVLHPVGRGARTFNPDTVEIRWGAC